MNKKYIATCFIAVFFMSALQAKATPDSSIVEPDYQSFVAAHAFPYVAPALRTDQII